MAAAETSGTDSHAEETPGTAEVPEEPEGGAPASRIREGHPSGKTCLHLVGSNRIKGSDGKYREVCANRACGSVLRTEEDGG